MRAAALLLVLAMAACSDRVATADPADANSLPAGAIPAGENLFMVPAGLLDGCPSFRAFSPGGATLQAIHFRRRGGGFTMNHGEADCTAP